MSQRRSLLDITSTNISVFIKVDEIVPNAVEIVNFSSDSSFQIDEQTVAEARMGVDGGMAMGYVPNPYNLTINLEASSPSVSVMQDIFGAMKQGQCVYQTTIIAEVPSIGKRFTWSGGGMTAGNVVPSPKKTLDPTSWKFIFAQCDISDI